MEKLTNLIVIGDPIIDCYLTLSDNITKKYEEKPGGASNTYANATAILGKDYTHFIPQAYFIEHELYKILRIISENDFISFTDIHLCAAENKDTYYSDAYLSANYIKWLKNNFSPESTIVLSDYNKGVLNTIFNPSFLYPYFRIMVCDTRYRSLNINYLKLAEQTFWRCTGNEYNKEYAKNFDYTIWTDSKKPIKVFNKKQKNLFTIIFDPEEEVDTCGAGDTFTAAFAAFLHESKEINLSTIKNAVHFSINCCQEVVQIYGTSITSCKIDKTLTTIH